MTVVAALAVAVFVPHVLRLERAQPSVAAAIWLAALLLRALLATLAAVLLLDLLPGTSPFNALAALCWNTTIPFISSHLGLSGVTLVRAAMVLPLALLAAWALTRVGQIARSHRAMRRTLSGNSLGEGPDGSLIVGGTNVIVAAAGLVRPEIVLSTGALTLLDDEELHAGIAHERGHIARRHRWWLAFAEVCGSVARLVPGTKHAMKQFCFHLERDADHWAVARTRNPLALASAICKSGSASTGVAALALNGAAAEDRVDQLLASAAGMRMNAIAQKSAATLAIMLVVGATAIASVVPSAAASGVRHLGVHSPESHCPL